MTDPLPNEPIRSSVIVHVQTRMDLYTGLPVVPESQESPTLETLNLGVLLLFEAVRCSPTTPAHERGRPSNCG